MNENPIEIMANDTNKQFTEHTRKDVQVHSQSGIQMENTGNISHAPDWQI